jgi:hypothetical protein
MSVRISGIKIDRVKIIDDNPIARKATALNLYDARFSPIEEPGPLGDLGAFIKTSIKTVDAIICDHRLTTHSYANFRGAEVVAKFYLKQKPAILSTAWSRADIVDLRYYRRYMPSVINSGELDPQTIMAGFRTCIQEIKGEFLPSRKPWRTLVRVVEADEKENVFNVELPGWDSNQVIKLPIDLVPVEFRSLTKEDYRFYAQVNIGADDQDDLFFDKLELS